MAIPVNEVYLSGRAGKDAQRSGNGPFRFSIAQGGGKKKNSEERWPTDWFNIVCWPNQCPEGELVRKGAEIEVWGRLKPTEWVKDGIKHFGYEIVATTIQVGDSKNPPLTPRSYAEPARSLAVTPENPITDEDIPF